MTKERKKTRELPGLPIERFKMAVTTLAELRDLGKFLVFLARGNEVRFVGETSAFQEAWAEKLAQESVERSEAKKTLVELRRFLSAAATLRDVDRLVSFLEQTVFGESFSEMSDEDRKRARSLLQKKARLVSETLLTPSLQQRADRLDTAVGASLEELDVEVVQGRQDEIKQRRVSAPFLRLRLRYTEARDAAFPFGPLVVLSGDGASFGASRSFEFEADETDIDLLLKRLIAAKDLLLRTVEGMADPEE